MNTDALNVLAAPGSKAPLRYIRQDGQEYLAADGNGRYEIENGIIRFLKMDELTGSNLRYQKMYDRFAPFYNMITAAYARLRSGGERTRVMQYLSELAIPDSSRVVEISIGTGRNIKYLNPRADYYGVDISLKMLRQCSRQMKKRGRELTLIQAEAENLPIRDETFDIVYSAGGFNFFNDRDKAVREMLRIAKKGSQLLISDETNKVQKSYGQVPLAGKFYVQESPSNPAEFVSRYCKDYVYREICNGELYVLTFRKP